MENNELKRIADELKKMNEKPRGIQVLFFIFLILKLIGKIDWSWWWVISPILFLYFLYFLKNCIKIEKWISK